MITLDEILTNGVKNFPNKYAFIFPHQKIKYKRLSFLVNKVTYVLASKFQIKKSDKVALLLYNSPEFVITYFAVINIGAIIIPINTMLSPEEIEYILDNAKPSLLVTSTEFSKILDNIKFPHNRIIITDDTKKVPKEYLSYQQEVMQVKVDACDIPDKHPDDIAVILYTSGTTGKPKGVMLTHRNLLSNINSALKAVEITHKDRILLFLPMFHSFTATVCMLAPLTIGARIIVLKSPKPFSRVIKAIIFQRVTIFIAIPPVYNILSRITLPRIFHIINPIRLCISGAAPLAPEVLRQFEQKFKIPLLEGYGLTEASPVVTINPLGLRKPGSVGKPIPEVEVKVVDKDEMELPIGEIGEIIVKGDNVMKGYFNQPEATAEVIKNGWLFTGDIGKIDEDGYVYIIDRKKDMIIVHGLNVYPREIEDVLYSHPKIAEVVVISQKEKYQEEIPVAIVVVKEGETVTQEELRKFCSDRLATYKVPRRFEFWDSLPKTPTGKILKREVRRIREEREKAKGK
jgi:long-chain acyl-CoA synthetase